MRTIEKNNTLTVGKHQFVQHETSIQEAYDAERDNKPHPEPRYAFWGQQIGTAKQIKRALKH